MLRIHKRGRSNVSCFFFQILIGTRILHFIRLGVGIAAYGIQNVLDKPAISIFKERSAMVGIKYRVRVFLPPIVGAGARDCLMRIKCSQPLTWSSFSRLAPFPSSPHIENISRENIENFDT